jgi:hypothetical protein
MMVTGTNAKATGSTTAIFAVSTNDTVSPNNNPMTMSFELAGNATGSSRYGVIQMGEYGTGNWRTLSLNPGGGNVGIGTTAPSSILGISGQSAQTIGMERHTTSATAGNALTIQAGGAFSGSTDKAGGDLYLKTGTGTGSGTAANIYLQTAAAGTTGTTDRTPATRVTVNSSGLAVSGQAYSAIKDNTSNTTFDFNNGNVQTSDLSCGAFTLQNMQDGGTYTVIVKGAVSGTCTFTHSGVTDFKFSPTNAASTASKHTIYTMLKVGATIYISWISGF